MSGGNRKRGEKEPVGRTKSAILLFLAANGESTYTQIRTHLEEKYNIRSSKDIRLHLDSLSSDNGLALITRITHGSGLANSYRIKEGFTSLKALFSFLQKSGLVPELMKTRYFIEYSATKDFLFLVNTNIIRNSMLYLHSCIMDDAKFEWLKSLLNEVGEEDRVKLIAWMNRIRAGDREELLSGGYMAMIEAFNSNDIDTIGKMYFELVTARGFSDIKVFMSRYGSLMSEFIIPETHKETLISMIRLSTGSLDFLLNSAESSPLFPPNIFLAYFYSLLMVPGDLYSSLQTIDPGAYRKYSAFVPRFTGDPPIFTIVRSLFISDMVYGRLVVKEVPDMTLRKILS